MIDVLTRQDFAIAGIVFGIIAVIFGAIGLFVQHDKHNIPFTIFISSMLISLGMYWTYIFMK